MKIFAFILFAQLLASRSCGSSVANSTDPQCPHYPCLVFEDNFDTLNLDTWQHEITAGGGGNGEFQYYHTSPKNTYTKNGILYIKPTLTSDDFGEEFVRTGTLDLWGGSPADQCTGPNYSGCKRSGGGGKIVNPVQSGKLRSAHGFSYKYGMLEVEAKMPTGDWLWPAIWMLPVHNAYGGWPASGEIDIVEARGNRNLRNRDGSQGGISEAGMTLHWGPKFPYNGYSKSHVAKKLYGGKTYGSHFHRYQVQWGPDFGIKFAIDDEHLLTVNPPNGFWEYGKDLWKDVSDKWNPWKKEQGATRMAPFDQPFYILMNVAVGGTNHYFSDQQINFPYPKPWRNEEPEPMTSFYNAKEFWYPTWKNGTDESAMQVNYIRVWKLKADS